MKIGNKIPLTYFIVSGKGESNLGIHTGSFDQALKDAGIPNVNLVFYSSILPKEAKEVKPKKLKFGSVVESIAAIAHGKKGQRVTAGLIIGEVFEKNKKIGSLVAEYSGNVNEERVKKELEARLNEMFRSRFKTKDFKLKKSKMIIKSFVPKKKFGTVIVAICFLSYKILKP